MEGAKIDTTISHVPRILHLEDLIKLIKPEEVIPAIEQAFLEFYNGEIEISAPTRFTAENGVVHVKGAAKKKDRFVVKVASHYPDNKGKGLSSMQAMLSLYDATNGVPIAVLFDNAHLTHHRTGAAGALAAKYLARENSERAVIIGTGTQGRLQLEYLMLVRPMKVVQIFSRDPKNAEVYATDMRARYPEVCFDVIDNLKNAVGAADIVVTTTPSRGIVIKSDWVTPGTHITAIGSDSPGKQELESKLLQKALYVADSIMQCAVDGELQHAIKDNLMKAEDVYGELGEIVAGKKAARLDTEAITVFDATGLGAQDLAIANYVMKRLG